MTRAPETLLAARRLLLDHLDVQPGRTAHADLDPAEVGIVGDPAHRGGYHCGADRVVSGDYSVVESSRDRTGLTDYACALDIGEFQVTVGGRTHNLRTFSSWLVGECMRGAPDTADIREVIYSTDGQSVRRWDRLRKRASGDGSHTWHTHISYHRDAIKAGRPQAPVFRRYLTTIGLIKAADQEDDMPLTDDDAQRVARAMLNQRLGKSTTTVGMVLQGLPVTLASLLGRDSLDADQVAAELAPALAPVLLAQLTPQAIAAAVSAEVAQDVIDALHARTAPVPGQARG